MTPDPSHFNSKAASGGWRDRLGTYALGVAIGCLMAGMLLYARKIGYDQTQQQKAAENAAAGAGKPTDLKPAQPNP